MNECEIAAELAFDVADLLEPLWATGHRGAFDRERLAEIFAMTWARHRITSVEQVLRILAQMDPLLFELHRRYQSRQDARRFCTER